MLDYFRKKARSPVLQATILVIIVVFIFWGVGRNSSNSRTTIATVNGTAIEYQDYRKEYDKTMSQLRDQFGGAIPKGLIATMDIKHQVLSRVIQRTLLRQGALDAGLYVSDQELKKAIEKMPAFQRNGTFNMKWYKSILANSRLTVAKFEDGTRYDLLAAKVRGHLARFSQVSPGELQALFTYEYTPVKFNYIAFNPRDYTSKVKAGDAKLAAFFAKNKANYQTAAKRKIKYLYFAFKDQKAATPSSTAIKDYYANNIKKYTTPERREARHILIRSKSSDTAAQVAAELKKIRAILVKARAGANFAALARKYSEDSLASRGGDLGFFSRGQLVKPFEDAAFSLPEGGISGVVKTRFGFHIIKVDKIETAQTKSLAAVRPAIVAELKGTDAKSLAFKAANDAYEQIIMAGSLDKYAAANAKAKIITTAFFAQQAPPKQIRDMPALTNAAFKLKKDELSSIVETDQGYVIAYVLDIRPPIQQKLRAVKAKVRQHFIAQESVKLARQAAGNFLATLRKGGSSFRKLAAQTGLKVQTTPFISRADSAAAKLAAPVLKEFLRLSANTPLPAQIITNGTTFYLASFAGRNKPAPGLFTQKKPALEKQLTAENNNELISSWLRYLQSKAAITTNEKLL